MPHIQNLFIPILNMMGHALPGGRRITYAAPYSEDADATAFFAALTTPPTQPRKVLYNDLIKGLKSDGDWNKFDWFVLLAANDEQAGRVNLRYPAKALVAVNSPTFTVDRGFTGDGATSYLNLNEFPSTAGGVYVQDSAHFSVYTNGVTGSGSKVHGGSGGGTGGGHIRLQPSTGSTGFCTINDATGSSMPTPGSASRLGMHTITRTAASGPTIKDYYLNNTLNFSGSAASTGIPATNTYVGRYTTVYGNDRHASMTLGSKLDAAAVTRVYARILTFLTAIGAN